MQLGEIIRGLSDEARAAEALVACGDIVLLARVDAMTARFEESVGDYASGAVRRFANLAESEDWLGLMNVLEPGRRSGRRLPDLHGRLVAEARRSGTLRFPGGSFSCRLPPLRGGSGGCSDPRPS